MLKNKLTSVFEKVKMMTAKYERQKKAAEKPQGPIAPVSGLPVRKNRKEWKKSLQRNDKNNTRESFSVGKKDGEGRRSESFAMDVQTSVFKIENLEEQVKELESTVDKLSFKNAQRPVIGKRTLKGNPEEIAQALEEECSKLKEELVEMAECEEQLMKDYQVEKRKLEEACKQLEEEYTCTIVEQQEEHAAAMTKLREKHTNTIIKLQEDHTRRIIQIQEYAKKSKQKKGCKKLLCCCK